jgi:hypothetical protein
MLNLDYLHRFGAMTLDFQPGERIDSYIDLIFDNQGVDSTTLQYRRIQLIQRQS